MSLLDLPDELLLLVSSAIEHHGDAVALALASRRLYQLADLRLRRKFRRIRFVPNTTTTAALEMCMQILKKPHLGHYVRHIEMDTFYRYRATKRLSRNDFQAEDLPLLCEAIRAARIIDSDNDEEILGIVFPPPPDFFKIREREEHKSADVLVTLLVSLSPNLTSIYYSDLGRYIAKVIAFEEEDGLIVEPADKPGSCSYLGRLLQDAGRAQRDVGYLQKLRTVRFLSDTGGFLPDGRFYVEVDYYHALNVIRCLPAVESVQFEGSTNSEQHMSIRPPPQSANYHTLAFHHSSPRFSVLNAIILSTKTLKRLTLSLGGRGMLGGHFNPLPPDCLLKTLLWYRHTLEYLDIDADDEVFVDEMFGNLGRRRDWTEDPEDDTEKKEYEEEWADELAALASSNEERAAIGAGNPAQRLHNLHQLKHLGMGKYTLCYLAQGVGSDRISDASFMLVDQIPANVETLRIYGMGQSNPNEKEDMNLRIDWHVSQLMKLKGIKLPQLQNVEGVDEPIPNGESVRRPDDNEELLWKREVEIWTDQEDGILWTDSEESQDTTE